MTAIRPTAFAGQFYPAEPAELAREIARYFAEIRPVDGRVPKALIAPHAGYVYSGPVAASAYAQVAAARGRITRVVLMGPSHRVAFRGIALSTAERWSTPLGDIAIDHATGQRLMTLPMVGTLDKAHAQEHSLEVHLPFLQAALGEFTLVPLVVGEAPADVVAAVLDEAWGGPETLIVISTDLSHFLDYETCRAADAGTVAAIERLDNSRIGSAQACGRVPMGGMLLAARQRHMEIVTLDVRNSGDTAGPKDRVVGYGAWALYEPEENTALYEPEENTALYEPEENTALYEPEDDPALRDTEDDPALRDIEDDPALRDTEDDPALRDTEDDPALRDTEDDPALRALGPILLQLAEASIRSGLSTGKPAALPDGLPAALGQTGAVFVTLKRHGQLRGCIGSATGWRALGEDVLDNAFKAAFADPRFPPLTEAEWDELKLSVSVLTPPVAMSFADQADLLAQLRPGIDGLIIEDQGRRALFLPSVWQQLPDKQAFLAHLKRKAGLAADHWSPAFKASRFQAPEVK